MLYLAHLNDFTELFLLMPSTQISQKFPGAAIALDKKCL